MKSFAETLEDVLNEHGEMDCENNTSVFKKNQKVKYIGEDQELLDKDFKVEKPQVWGDHVIIKESKTGETHMVSSTMIMRTAKNAKNPDRLETTSDFNTLKTLVNTVTSE